MPRDLTEQRGNLGMKAEVVGVQWEFGVCLFILTRIKDGNMTEARNAKVQLSTKCEVSARRDCITYKVVVKMS